MTVGEYVLYNAILAPGQGFGPRRAPGARQDRLQSVPGLFSGCWDVPYIFRAGFVLASFWLRFGYRLALSVRFSPLFGRLRYGPMGDGNCEYCMSL